VEAGELEIGGYFELHSENMFLKTEGGDVA
jgi:hypothetical protein